jgi:hypothetical protein
MPFFGLELLDMAREVAAFNLPARVGASLGERPVAPPFDTPHEVHAFPWSGLAPCASDM